MVSCYPRRYWFAHIGGSGHSFKTPREARAWIDSQDWRSIRSRNARYTNATIVQAVTGTTYHGTGRYTGNRVRLGRSRGVATWVRDWRRLR